MTNLSLKSSQSLYLKQHQNDPVSWMPYSKEALELAKKKQLPVFLSIGYSSCHWCHVMNKNTFKNHDVSDLLNENFISIKVDREEFPALDNYFQTLSQANGQASGWPLSVFLTSEMEPFFIGTYFPATSENEQRPGFIQLLEDINEHLQNEEKKEFLIKRSNEMLANLNRDFVIPEGIKNLQEYPSPSAIINALEESKDEKNFGYGKAPKFPHFSFYEWSLEQILEKKVDSRFHQHLIDSIESLWRSGLYDQVRGGIHRYSTDVSWTIPHFEKMIYDQAGLLRLMTKFSFLSSSPLLEKKTLETLDYLEKEMFEDHFFSAQDADSEGFEGLYFTYAYDEFLTLIKDIPHKEEWASILSIKKEGNFEDDLNQLHLSKDSFYAIQKDTKKLEEFFKIKSLLLKERQKRIPPATDTKGIAGLNFMMLSSLIEVARRHQSPLAREKALELVKKGKESIKDTFISGEGKIRHCTTLEDNFSYFEDEVFYLEYLINEGEFFGLEENFTLAKSRFKSIIKNFCNIQEEEFYSIHLNEENPTNHPNGKVSSFDLSYASPVSNFFISAKKLITLLEDSEIELISRLESKWQKTSLLFPFGSGEALRAFSTKLNDLRWLKVTPQLHQQQEFQTFIGAIPWRISILVQNDLPSQFMLCSERSCEKSGESLKELMDIFRPS